MPDGAVHMMQFEYNPNLTVSAPSFLGKKNNVVIHAYE